MDSELISLWNYFGWTEGGAFIAVLMALYYYKCWVDKRFRGD